MKSKRGFTLVELLAVIVILGILLSISTVAVNKIRKNQEEENFKNQVSSVLTGAKSYVSDNPSILYKLDKTSNSNDTVKFSVSKLINEDYVSIDSKDIDKFNNSEISISFCDGNVDKLKYSITIDRKTYDDCGCEPQTNSISKKICTN